MIILIFIFSFLVLSVKSLIVTEVLFEIFLFYLEPKNVLQKLWHSLPKMYIYMDMRMDWDRMPHLYTEPSELIHQTIN